MQAIVATGNKGKLAEFEEALGPLGWQLSTLEGWGVTLPPETGATYEENAFIKAGFTTAVTGEVTIADDSGLEVDALGGEPGVYSARFGNRDSDLERNLYLLDLLKDVPTPRTARFVSVIVIAFPTGWTQSYRGEVEGQVLEGPRGSGGFGYDPLFYSPELGKTFAEASVAEKRQVSHRGRALAQMLKAFQKGNARTR